MAETDRIDRKRTPFLERVLEWIIYSSRWLMAPVYLGLIAALAILIVTFFRELYFQVPLVMEMDETDIILLVLTLVDLSLAGNLVLIILFTGYESFVSKIDAAHMDHDRPDWMGTLDFSGMASASAAVTASSRARPVTLSVAKSEGPSTLQSATSVRATRSGPGRM